MTITDAEGTRTRSFVEQVVTLGRAPYSDVTTQSDGATRQHARLFVAGRGAVTVRDLASTMGTFKNGARVSRAGVPLAAEDVLTLGSDPPIATLTVRWEPLAVPAAVDPIERGLLDELRRAPGDEATRAVYADWLEEHGDRARAAYLRGDGGDAKAIPAAWRALVSVARLTEGACARGAECPGRWDRLTTTDSADFRRCGTCAREIRWCTKRDEQASLANEGFPTALER